jgi:hypothetical protein
LYALIIAPKPNDRAKARSGAAVVLIADCRGVIAGNRVVAMAAARVCDRDLR